MFELGAGGVLLGPWIPSPLQYNLKLSMVYPIPFYGLYFKLKELVSSLPGVSVTCRPRDLNVSLLVSLESEGEIKYSWTIHVCYEVRH